MASKVFVGVNHGGFFQQGKRREDVVNLGYVGSTATNPELRVKHLERNIRFLQEQHQIMLSGLHREVEVLRRRNRDLQFQMVFSHGGVTILDTTPTSSPEECVGAGSSPEECPRVGISSPGHVNITPLQIELLERDLAEMKTGLGEARTRNLYLQSVAEEQKKVIEKLEGEQSEMAAVGTKISPVNKSVEATGNKKLETPIETAELNAAALHDKLEDAESTVRRLRRENEEQRKEILSLRSAVGRVMPERRNESGYRQHQHYPRYSENQQYSHSSRFPPLYPNNHWGNSKYNGEYHRDRKRREDDGQSSANTSLPLLKERNNGPSTSGYNSGGYNGQQGGGHRRSYPHSQRGNRSYRNQNREPRDDPLSRGQD